MYWQSRRQLKLLCEDGKWPEGVSLNPLSKGKCLAWNVTVPDTYAHSHLTTTSSAVRSAASEAAIHKTANYNSIASMHHFVPMAIEMSRVFHHEAEEFMQQVGHRCTELR